MAENMHTAVLIHGCHLYAKEWENIVWGDPKRGVFGRVPTGIRVAQSFDAETIFFPTGASEKEGLKEGAYTFRYAKRRIGELGLQSAWIEHRAVIELTSKNTREEVLACASIAKMRGAKRLVLVSSPTHTMRCHQAAISTLSAEPEFRFFLRELYVVASDTCYADSTVDDVAIFEPPHRADLPNIPFHITVRRLFQFMRHEKPGARLNQAIDALVSEHERTL